MADLGWRDQEDTAAAVDLRKHTVQELIARWEQAVGRPNLQLHLQHRAVLLCMQQAVQPQPVDLPCTYTAAGVSMLDRST